MSELMETVRWLMGTAIPIINDYAAANRIRSKKYESFKELEAERVYGWFSIRAKEERMRHYHINNERLDPNNF